jgi:hypothetical protein
MPYGSLLKQKHPQGVMNVVSKREDCESFLCQKALFASNFENTLDIDNFPIVKSTDGRGYASLNTLLFNWLNQHILAGHPHFGLV